MSIAEGAGTEGWNLQFRDGATEMRQRMLMGAVVCTRKNMAAIIMAYSVEVPCTFCGETCYRPEKIPADYITVCNVCCVKALGPASIVRE